MSIMKCRLYSIDFYPGGKHGAAARSIPRARMDVQLRPDRAPEFVVRHDRRIGASASAATAATDTANRSR